MKRVKIDLVDAIFIALQSNALDEDERRTLQDFMNWRSSSHPLIVVPIIEIVDGDTQLGRPNPAEGE